MLDRRTAAELYDYTRYMFAAYGTDKGKVRKWLTSSKKTSFLKRIDSMHEVVLIDGKPLYGNKLNRTAEDIRIIAANMSVSLILLHQDETQKSEEELKQIIKKLKKTFSSTAYRKGRLDKIFKTAFCSTRSFMRDEIGAVTGYIWFLGLCLGHLELYYHPRAYNSLQSKILQHLMVERTIIIGRPVLGAIFLLHFLYSVYKEYANIDYETADRMSYYDILQDRIIAPINKEISKKKNFSELLGIPQDLSNLIFSYNIPNYIPNYNELLGTEEAGIFLCTSSIYEKFIVKKDKPYTVESFLETITTNKKEGEDVFGCWLNQNNNVSNEEIAREFFKNVFEFSDDNKPIINSNGEFEFKKEKGKRELLKLAGYLCNHPDLSPFSVLDSKSIKEYLQSSIPKILKGLYYPGDENMNEKDIGNSIPVSSLVYADVNVSNEEGDIGNSLPKFSSAGEAILEFSEGKLVKKKGLSEAGERRYNGLINAISEFRTSINLNELVNLIKRKGFSSRDIDMTSTSNHNEESANIDENECMKKIVIHAIETNMDALIRSRGKKLQRLALDAVVGIAYMSFFYNWLDGLKNILVFQQNIAIAQTGIFYGAQLLAIHKMFCFLGQGISIINAHDQASSHLKKLDPPVADSQRY
jgi:hypothetical protein